MENKRERKTGVKYKASEEKKKKNFKILDNIIYINYKISNKDLICKIGISETEFYRTYAKKVKEIKNKYAKQSLF